MSLILVLYKETVHLRLEILRLMSTQTLLSRGNARETHAKSKVLAGKRTRHQSRIIYLATRRLSVPLRPYWTQRTKHTITSNRTISPESIETNYHLNLASTRRFSVTHYASICLKQLILNSRKSRVKGCGRLCRLQRRKHLVKRLFLLPGF